MMSSPEKKKLKMELMNAVSKRPLEYTDTPSKRANSSLKNEESREKKIQTLKRKNFIKACEQASYQAYSDYHNRFLLVYLPKCLTGECQHYEKEEIYAKEIPGFVEEAFKIEIKTNMWYEALEVCHLSITPKQYLSANVLKDVVEIMLNAHGDTFAGYTATELIDESQEVIFESFCTHPPCMVKGIRNSYNKFLTSPMALKENTFTNRTEFASNKGIVKYCMNRLEYEMSNESKDKPLVNKYENIPEDMKQSVKGLYWQKDKFEIYELLDRTQRIERLMAVLDSIIDLMQFDLAIWHSRHTTNQGRHIMRSQRPLMAFVLWSDNVLYTGAVNTNCRQILRIFVNFVHLDYPEHFIKIMTNWLNTIIQTFYVCESNSNSSYPNIGKYCTKFAKEFYTIISEYPHKTIIKILQIIQPTFMAYLIAMLHLKEILSTKEDDILRIMIDFIKQLGWNEYPETEEEIDISRILKRKKLTKIKDIQKYMDKFIKKLKDTVTEDSINFTYRKIGEITNKNEEITQNYVVHCLFIALDTYLAAFNVHNVQYKLEKLNEELENSDSLESDIEMVPESYSYSVSEDFIKKYRNIYQLLKELMLLIHNSKCNEQLPDILKVFKHIEILGL